MSEKINYDDLLKKTQELEQELNKKDDIIADLKAKIDDTEIKRLEKELQKSREKAESSEKFKDTFLANISHAIRTPMNAIIGFSELIAMESIHPKRKEEYTRIINEKGHQLLTLIDDIIEISRIEAGKLTINNTSINLDEFLHEIFSITLQKKIRLGKDQVELILRKNPGKTEVVLTDPGRLQQILNNLLNFSLRNTLKGNIEFGYSINENNIIEFFIQDTGFGLNKEDQKLIFDYFWQFEDVSHQRLSGIGLGITIAKKIIELMGGKIRIVSEINAGTQFQFTIPMEIPVRETTDTFQIEIEQIEDNLEPNWKDRVILVVEDDEVNYQFIEALVEKTQAQLLHAENGVQALELVKTINKIDLILMDIKLPEINGYQITKEIKQIKKDVPIIAQTAFTLSDVKDKCLEAGCSDVIAKPIEIPLFFNKVNKFLMLG
jgi:signal transduction histidine kinase/CheY-like chemotaxis protein